MSVFDREYQRLTTERVVQIFEKFKPEDGFHTDKIENPKSGDVVIFWSKDEFKSRDWVSDGISWRNVGCKKPTPPPPNAPLFFKTYYQLIDSNKALNKNVIKDVFFHLDQVYPIVIHYLDKTKNGNADLDYPSAAHGNTKNKDKAEGFARTLPSVYSQLKDKVASKNPHMVYKESSKKSGARDLKQCQNLRYAVNRLRRFTYDEIANCNLMHISLYFPNHIVTAPDIRIIAIDDELMNETKKALGAFDCNSRVCFQFDTTFNLTGYYVSVLLYIHPILLVNNSEKSPTIPLAYFIHEKKHQKSHNEFWRYIQEVLPELEDKGFIVTDYEAAFRNAIKKYFPSVPLLRCWNHFWKSTDRWISSCKSISNHEIGFYCESLRELLLQPTQNQFEIQLANKTNGYTNSSGHTVQPWSTAFENYFKSNIYDEIDSLAAYAVKPIVGRFFNHFTGITTNQCEGVNNLLKLVQQRNELPLDVVTLTFHQLSIYYCNEIKFGFGNRGNYRLKPDYYEMCYVNTKYVNTRESIEPSKIIESLVKDREQLLKTCGVRFSTVSEESATDSSETESLPGSTEHEPLSSENVIEGLENRLADFDINESPKTLTQSTKTIGSTLQNCSSDEDVYEDINLDVVAAGDVDVVEDVDVGVTEDVVEDVDVGVTEDVVEDVDVGVAEDVDTDDLDDEHPFELKSRHNSN